MRRTILALAVSVACATAPRAPPPEPEPIPPVAKVDPKVDEHFGDKRVDNYAWMRTKDSPEVLAYLKAENAYADAKTKRTAVFQRALYDEMLGHIKETDLDVPFKRGGFYYYSRTEKGKQYPYHCRRKGSVEAPEQLILDPNELARSEKFFVVGLMEVSDDGNLLAYSADTTGFRQYALHVKDLAAGTTLPDTAVRVNSLAWAADSRTFFYVVEDPTTKRPYRLYRHTLGGAAGTDALVYEEKDEKFELEVERTRSGGFVLLTAASQTASEVRFLDAKKPTGEFKVVAKREKDHEYYVDHRDPLFYIRTNSGGRNFRLMTAPVATPSRASWSEMVPHRDDVMLEHVALLASHCVLHEREGGVPRLRVIDVKTRKAQRVDFPEPIYELSPGDNEDFEAAAYRFEYESLVTPRSVIDYDLTRNDAQVRKRLEVVSYDPAQYSSERLEVPVADGARIPVSFVTRGAMVRDGKRPMVLYGYGAYGVPFSATFDSNRLALLDRGVTVAIAHVRGGGELGKKWHDQGRMLSKKNTFGDFVAVADWLVKEGYTSKDRLVAIGASAGGLLMGVLVNQRPDLFRAVVAKMPFVDVINTMLDESLPLTITEFEEWGNPKVEAEYRYMRAYSPYDNVEAKAYPAMLVRTSLNDSEVMYWEPAKWVAKLRASKTDANPLVFRINLDPAGHGGLSGRYDRLRDAAFDFAFVLYQLGVAQ